MRRKGLNNETRLRKRILARPAHGLCHRRFNRVYVLGFGGEMVGALRVITPADQTLIEIAELAAVSNVVLVERRGRIALCSAERIPFGWHRMAVGIKASKK